MIAAEMKLGNVDQRGAILPAGTDPRVVDLATFPLISGFDSLRIRAQAPTRCARMCQPALTGPLPTDWLGRGRRW